MLRREHYQHPKPYGEPVGGNNRKGGQPPKRKWPPPPTEEQFQMLVERLRIHLQAGRLFEMVEATADWAQTHAVGSAMTVPVEQLFRHGLTVPDLVSLRAKGSVITVGDCAVVIADHFESRNRVMKHTHAIFDRVLAAVDSWEKAMGVSTKG